MSYNIPKIDMRDYCVYLCNARNFKFGIWYGELMYGIRHKFGSVFIDTEYHYDDDCGTCQPVMRVTDPLKDTLDATCFNRSSRRGQAVLMDVLAGFDGMTDEALDRLQHIPQEVQE